MIFREALLPDIPHMSFVRMSVKENRLSNPGLVTEKDYVEFLTVRGKGWVCELNNKVVGFAIGDLVQNNIWALFIQPGYEGKGIGQKLLSLLLNWYFINTKTTIWLGTAPGTRAATFYRRFGWKEVGKQPNSEVKFELSVEDWKVLSSEF